MSRRHSSFLEAFQHFCSSRELRYARCPVCHAPLPYAQRVCPQHPEDEVEWLEASGKAVLHTSVEYHIGYNKNKPAPYQLAVVELEEGPRLVATLEPAADGQIQIGAPLSAGFDAEGRLVFRAEREIDRQSRRDLALM